MMDYEVKKSATAMRQEREDKRRAHVTHIVLKPETS